VISSVATTERRPPIIGEVVETPALKAGQGGITRLNEELELRVVQRTAQLTAPMKS